jgi:hypothetical protein
MKVLIRLVHEGVVCAGEIEDFDPRKRAGRMFYRLLVDGEHAGWIQHDAALKYIRAGKPVPSLWIRRNRRPQ